MSDDDRDETEEEKLDRKWNDQLQELRVMQTGAQLTSGFLLTLPFQSSFGDLDSFQRGLYLALVFLAAATLVFVMTPVAVHRRISGQHVKERLVRTAHWALVGVLLCVSSLVVGMTTLIVDVVVGRSVGLTVGAVFAVAAVALLAVLPRRLDPQRAGGPTSS
ncbi:MAG: DUF6328 family protein [Nocardioidaceae bacterium]